MPNWNYNKVCITAPLKEVEKCLISTLNIWVMFNMHLLFPERFWPDDLDWQKNWNCEWARKNTGSQWFPACEVKEEDGFTYLLYATAKEPNNKTLKKLSQLWGWTIFNQYEDADMCFEWIAAICDWKIIHHHRTVYRLRCSVCNRKFSDSELLEYNSSKKICKNCSNKTK